MLDFIPYNLEEDIKNYLVIFRIRKKVNNIYKVCDMFESGGWGRPTKERLEKFIRTFSNNYKIDFKTKIKEFNEKWKKIESEAVRRMENIFDLKCKKIKVYLTTNDHCAYSYRRRLFFLFALTSSPMKICLHELFHFYCWQKFGKELKKIKKDKKYFVLESMTVVLNSEFRDLMEVEDEGKPDYKEVRRILADAWKFRKNIEEIFNLAMQLKNGRDD